MAGFTNIMLIPKAELPKGAITAMRNSVIATVKKLASTELKLSEDQLVARDIRWVEDLQAYSTGTTAATVNNWIFTTAGSTTTGFVTVTGDQTCAVERFIAIYGVKDLRCAYDIKGVTGPTYHATLAHTVSQIRIDVGGGIKAIWDLLKMENNPLEPVGISPAAVLIPQNTVYNIYYYKHLATNSTIANLVLEGVVVEPRGKVISP